MSEEISPCDYCGEPVEYPLPIHRSCAAAWLRGYHTAKDEPEESSMSERQMWEFPSKMIEYAQKLLSIPEDAIVEIRAPIDQDFFHDDVPKVVLSPEILRELARNYLKTHQVVEADPEF